MKNLYSLFKCFLSSFLSSCLLFFPLYSSPLPPPSSTPINSPTPSPAIVIDPSSLNTSLDVSANGVDILNIATPNAQGISNNLFLEFNVKENGLIFNNSTLALTPSLLAELMSANPNLSNPASLILNQVTSTSASTLLGLMEIAGSSASLLIANPNGITCEGCGFINANHVTLSTGLPEIRDNGLIEVRVQRGEINLNSLNALGSTSLSLLAKHLSINAKLYTNALRVILGSNAITLNEKGSLLLWQPIEREDHSTSLALDVGYLGRVYASSIFMVASDEGVEAKIKGVMATYPTQREGDGGFYIDINGDLKISKREGRNWAEENNSLSSSLSQESFSSNSLPNKQNNPYEVIQESLNINQGRFKENKGLNGEERLTHKGQEGENLPSLFSSSSIHLSSKTLSNEGYILSLDNSSIQTQTLTNSSVISSNQILNLKAKEIKNTHGLIQGNDLLITSDKLNNTQGFILAKENAFIQANEIVNRAKLTLTQEKISEEHISIGRWQRYDQGGFFPLSYLRERDKDYKKSIYEDKIQSFIPSMLYAGNSLLIQAQSLENFDGQIGGEVESNLNVLTLNNHATQAQRKIIKSGREAKHYTKRVKCGFFDFLTCGHKNVTAFGVLPYNPAAEVSKIELNLPSFQESLASAQSLTPKDFNPLSSFTPKEIKSKEITQERVKDFILSDYFKQRLLSLSLETQEEFLTSLSSQERSAFISSLSKNDQNYLLKNFNNIHLDSFSSTLSLQNLPILLALNQRLNQELQNTYTTQTQQDKNTLLSLPSILNITSSSLSGNIGGENVYIEAKVLNNEGSIVASKEIFTQTKKRLGNTGSIEAENITLNSEGEIENIGGKIDAKENLALSADSITMSSSIYTQESYKEYTSFQLSPLRADEAQTSSLPLFKSANHLRVLATQSQTLLSSSFLGGKNITLNAKNSLSLSATKLNATNNLILHHPLYSKARAKRF